MQITLGTKQSQRFLSCKFTSYKMTQDYEELLSKMYGGPLEENYEKFQRKKEYFKKTKFKGRF